MAYTPISLLQLANARRDAQNLEHFVNDVLPALVPTRIGGARPNYAKLVDDFRTVWDRFLISSGYEDVGDYAAGLHITARNQIFWRNGELYRASAGLKLPYTVSGNWGTEGGSFVSVGDAALRQELGSPSGASLVSFKAGGSSAVSRPVSARLGEQVSVMDYADADPTGVSVSDAAIIAAYAVSDIPIFPDGVFRTAITATRLFTGPGKILRMDGSDAPNFINPLRRRVFVIAVTGQSNAVGAHAGGPNPANPLIKVWDGHTTTWGSSDYTLPPFSRSSPDGNGGHNNIGLALAHRLADEYGAQVFLIYDAAGGRPIEDWVATGTASERYAALKTKVALALKSPELVNSHKTKLDCLIWAQGEDNALTDTMADYRTKLGTLDRQLRAEPWMGDTTPMLIMGMSGLHTRYQVWQAQLDYCENVNRSCIYVNSVGLKTAYDVDPVAGGDFTHFLGTSLWEHGYHRAWHALQERAFSHRQGPAALWARGVGPWRGETVAITAFNSLVSSGCASSRFPYNGPGTLHAISWGENCSAANNSLAGGMDVSQNALARYSISWGRALAATSGADYSAVFGWQNTAAALYTFVAGRGNTAADAGGASFGTFSRYATPQADPVLFQVGYGTSSSVAKNAITARASGLVEFDTNATGDPAQAGELVFRRISNTSLRVLMKGSDGVVRGANLTLSP